MEQRAKADTRRFNIYDLAADIWDAAELEDLTPLAEWLEERPEADSIAIIPEEEPAIPSSNPLFAPNRVHFGKANTDMDYRSREQAELVVRLANLGISGELKLPGNPKDCIKLLNLVNERLKQAHGRFEELAKSRTGDERLREHLTDLLMGWFVKGREIGKLS